MPRFIFWKLCNSPPLPQVSVPPTLEQTNSVRSAGLGGGSQATGWMFLADSEVVQGKFNLEGYRATRLKELAGQQGNELKPARGDWHCLVSDLTFRSGRSSGDSHSRNISGEYWASKKKCLLDDDMCSRIDVSLYLLSVLFGLFLISLKRSWSSQRFTSTGRICWGARCLLIIHSSSAWVYCYICSQCMQVRKSWKIIIIKPI